MIDSEICAGLREKALFIGTYSVFKLLFAGRLSEIGRGSSYVVYIALEVRVFYEQTGFFDYRLMAAGLYYAPLMKRQSAEAAAAEAPPVAYQAEFNLLDGVDAAGVLIAGMISPHIGQSVDTVHFLLRERL